MQDLYFAFGSNLSAKHWAEWAGARGVEPSLLRPVEAAWLPDHRLDFNYYARVHQAGAANIMHSPGQIVPGFLFQAPPAAMAALDQKEGHPNCYARTECVVLTADGRPVHAVTYKVVPDQEVAFQAPSEAYLNRIRAGYGDRGLGRELTMLEEVAAGRPAPRLVPWVLTYDTRREGGPLRHQLAQFGVEAVDEISVPGRMCVDGGPRVGAVFWPAGDGRVAGERFALKDLEKGIVALDALQGVGQGAFRRVLVDAGTDRAWAYQLVDGTDP